ncbi:MAG: hypothetical protein QOI30_1303, partial [Mycobacterium sp.]|nr:hypothetical protein [Mycobacterium sp.]
IELLREDSATHIAGIRINSFTSTFVLIGAVVYLILAPKGREDPATLSGSAAELLEPDEIEDNAADSPTETSETPPSVVAADKAETTVDQPDVEAEAVAVEADAAEVDAPEVEVAAKSPEEDEAADQPAPEPTDSTAARPDPG